jgi:hypothetical protein
MLMNVSELPSRLETVPEFLSRQESPGTFQPSFRGLESKPKGPENPKGVLFRVSRYKSPCLYTVGCTFSAGVFLATLSILVGTMYLYYFLKQQGNLSDAYTVLIYVFGLFLFFVLAISLFLCIGLTKGLVYVIKHPDSAERLTKFNTYSALV